MSSVKAALQTHARAQSASLDPHDAAVYARAEELFVAQLERFWGCPHTYANFSRADTSGDPCADPSITFPGSFNPGHR